MWLKPANATSLIAYNSRVSRIQAIQKQRLHSDVSLTKLGKCCQVHIDLIGFTLGLRFQPVCRGTDARWITLKLFFIAICMSKGRCEWEIYRGELTHLWRFLPALKKKKKKKKSINFGNASLNELLQKSLIKTTF